MLDKPIDTTTIVNEFVQPTKLDDDLGLKLIDETASSENHRQQQQQYVVESAEQSIQNENSTSFPFGSNLVQSDMAALYDQSSASGLANVPQTTDSIDNLLANLAEDNANSLPSGDDESRFAAALEATNATNHIATSEQHTIENNCEVIATADDVDMDEILNAANQDDSPPAIAEDLANGDNSQATKVDIDAEMVSEDELPAPSQAKVDDAEEVSDEELPGPKLAELPADTEVVSEDELPSSNKSKRKVDEGYDPGSPTESSEIPEKKAKADDEADDGQLEKIEFEINVFGIFNYNFFFYFRRS